jgi:hypothetical protein
MCSCLHPQLKQTSLKRNRDFLNHLWPFVSSTFFIVTFYYYYPFISKLCFVTSNSCLSDFIIYSCISNKSKWLIRNPSRLNFGLFVWVLVYK